MPAAWHFCTASLNKSWGLQSGPLFGLTTTMGFSCAEVRIVSHAHGSRPYPGHRYRGIAILQPFTLLMTVSQAAERRSGLDRTGQVLIIPGMCEYPKSGEKLANDRENSGFTVRSISKKTYWRTPVVPADATVSDTGLCQPNITVL